MARVVRNAGVLIRAALFSALSGLVLLAISCGGSPSPNGETVESSSSQVTSCGSIALAASVYESPASQSLSGAGAIIPDVVPISNFGGFYPGIVVTATLGVGSVTCTYTATFSSTWGDATFQSCSDGAVPGSVRQGANVTLSIVTTPSYWGTTAAATVGKSPDDGSSCTLDTCSNGVVNHSPAPDGTSCDPDNDVCTGTQTCSGGLCNSAVVAAPTDDGDICTNDGCSPSTGITHTLTCSPPPNLPPNGGSDPTLPRDFSKSVEFRYKGANVSQFGVDPTQTINAARAAIIRGTVRDASGPLQDAIVTVLNRGEYGTRRRALMDATSSWSTAATG
ncbi:hypothetical protein BH09MYX1_BH09MYX1_28310 [soil metagenome]